MIAFGGLNAVRMGTTERLVAPPASVSFGVDEGFTVQIRSTLALLMLPGAYKGFVIQRTGLVLENGSGLGPIS